MAEGESQETIIGRLDERMKGIEGSLKRIEDYMASRPCPSTLCQKHENDIIRIDTELKLVATVFSMIVAVAVGLIYVIWR
jgi:hypothetical protein